MGRSKEKKAAVNVVINAVLVALGRRYPELEAETPQKALRLAEIPEELRSRFRGFMRASFEACLVGCDSAKAEGLVREAVSWLRDDRFPIERRAERLDEDWKSRNEPEVAAHVDISLMPEIGGGARPQQRSSGGPAPCSKCGCTCGGKQRRSGGNGRSRDQRQPRRGGQQQGGGRDNGNRRTGRRGDSRRPSRDDQRQPRQDGQDTGKGADRLPTPKY